MENYSARVKAEPGQAGPAYSSGGGQSLKNVLFTSLIISFSRIRVQLSEDPIRSHLLLGPIGVSLEQILQLLDQSEHGQLSGTDRKNFVIVLHLLILLLVCLGRESECPSIIYD